MILRSLGQQRDQTANPMRQPGLWWNKSASHRASTAADPSANARGPRRRVGGCAVACGFRRSPCKHPSGNPDARHRLGSSRCRPDPAPAQCRRASREGRHRDHSTRPICFLSLPPADLLSAWKASIDAMEKIAPECACIVSSHFSLLATAQDRPHAAFRAQEESRRAGLIKRARLDPANLERWTDALGFCDLLSLYMCSGVAAPARIPRVHPARKSSAPPLQIISTGNTLQLSEPFVTPGSTFHIDGLIHPFPASGSAAQRVTWSIG